MDFFKHSFNGDEWNIYLAEDNDSDLFDEDARAVTKFDDKEMFFRRGELEKMIVAHEVWHVYFSYLYLEHTSNIPIEDVEEITCTMYSYKREVMNSDIDLIFQKLTQLKKGEK